MNNAFGLSNEGVQVMGGSSQTSLVRRKRSSYVLIYFILISLVFIL